MFAAIEWVIAARYLRARRQEGFISVIAWFSLLGIALGVATLIIVMSVMNGFRAELLGRVLGINGHLTIQAFSGPLIDYDAKAKQALANPRVRAAVPIVDGQVMVTHAGGASGAMVRGMRPEDLAGKKLIAGNIVRGSLADFGADDTILMGNRLAARLRVSPGERVTLIAPQSTATAIGTLPRMKSFRVAGTFDSGMFEYDNGFIFMPLAMAQPYFKVGAQAVTGVELMLDDADSALAVRRELMRTMADVELYDWQRANAAFFSALQTERNVMFLILTLIILVAAFNIVSSLIMLVKDKTRAIAILRTMGATRGAIQRIFFICGSSVGVVGTLVGFVLGLSFCLNIEEIRQLIQKLTNTQLFPGEIYFLSRLPARVDAGEVAVVVILALVLTVLATLYPSWRAARLDPVEALRYE